MKLLNSLIIFLLLTCTFSLSGQNEQLNYDFMIDYYPKIKNINTDSTSNMKMNFSGEFIEAIEIISKKVFNSKVEVNRLSGMQMVTSGIYPKQLLEANNWLKIVIANNGEIDEFNVFTSNGKMDKVITNKFMKYLKGADINPATKNETKVKCMLFYYMIY